MNKIAILKAILITVKDAIKNILFQKKYDLFYITEAADWSIKKDGEYITKNLNNLRLIKCRKTTSHLFLRKKIIHFGSLNTLVGNNKIKKIHPSNKIILTCFHIADNDPRIKFFKSLNKIVDVFHTACNYTKDKMINLGIPKKKIIVIPLGVDLSIFKPSTIIEKKLAQDNLNIPQDKIVIGSFQKDGVGWGRGLEPKLIKGPDIFVRVIEKIAKKYPIFVLLVGPARGYIMNELQKLKIPCLNIGFLKKQTDVIKYYRALDLYLITSRIEGGPKAILESWASGIPLISTKVGMVPDISKHKKNILIADVGNVNEFADQVESILKNKELKNELTKNGLEEVEKYNWEIITEKYYNQIYGK